MVSNRRLTTKTWLNGRTRIRKTSFRSKPPNPTPRSLTHNPRFGSAFLGSSPQRSSHNTLPSFVIALNPSQKMNRSGNTFVSSMTSPIKLKTWVGGKPSRSVQANIIIHMLFGLFWDMLIGNSSIPPSLSSPQRTFIKKWQINFVWKDASWVWCSKQRRIWKHSRTRNRHGKGFF